MAKVSTYKTISLIILFVLCIALCLAIAFLINTKVAFAQDVVADFEIIFPTTHYIQFSNPTFVAKSNNYIAIYDEVEKKVLTIDGQQNRAIIDLTNYYPIKNIWVLQNTLLIQYTENDTTKYAKKDLGTANSAFENVTIPSPTGTISSITSDGTYLYVKALNGYLSVYDSTFAIYNNFENIYMEGLIGRFPVSGSGETLVTCIPNDLLEYELNVISLSTGVVNLKSNIGNTGAQIVAYNGTYIFAYFRSLEKLSVYNASTCAKLFDMDNFSLSQLMVSGNDVYCIIEDKVYIYNINSEQTNLTLVNYYSKTGSDSEHLNNPQDVVINNGTIYVADQNNNRVLLFDETTYSFTSSISVSKPQQITFANNKRWFVISGKNIVEYDRNTEKTKYKFENEVTPLAMTWMKKLYILGKEGAQTSIYTLYSGLFYKLIDVNNAKDISTTADGSFIYVLIEENGQQVIKCFNDKGVESLVVLNLDITNAIHFKVDAIGNIYVLTNDSKIIKYTRKAVSFVKTDTLSLTNDIYTSVPNNFSFADNNKIIFSSKDSFIAKADMEHDDVVVPTPVPSIENATCNIYQTNAKTLFFVEPNVLEDALIVEQGEMIPVFENASQIDGLVYGYYNNQYGYFNSNYLTLLNITEEQDHYMITIAGNIKLHKFPIDTADSITVGQNVMIQYLSDIADYDSAKWYKVKYEDNIYYVLRQSVTNYDSEEQVEQPTYAKAQAHRIGGQIKLYSTPSEDSSVIMTIADGQTIEVYDEIEGFYFVKYNGQSGYTKVDDVKLSGLTSAQIIGIVLAILTALAGGAIFVITNISRKKQKDVN